MRFILLAQLACCFCATSLWGNSLIVVAKHNVIHKFASYDERTNNFVKHVFPTWETETFDIFDQVKDPQGIAIDLGAWIGTTAIWLSKNFYHVVAVDGDRVSIHCLKKNLEASECYNVSVCDQPIADNDSMVMFGPLFGGLNESTSSILTQPRPDGYSIKGITLTQLVHNFITDQKNLADRKITFIKCDIEGGEELILKDLLEFAELHQAKLYVSFHLDWWKTKKIAEFDELFKRFKTNCPEKSVVEYITKNPFGSILFEQ